MACLKITSKIHFHLHIYTFLSGHSVSMRPRYVQRAKPTPQRLPGESRGHHRHRGGRQGDERGQRGQTRPNSLQQPRQ